jgi:hypothetical protein
MSYFGIPPDLLDQILKGVQAFELIRKAVKWGINRYRWRKIPKPAQEIAFSFHSYSWHDLHQSAPTIREIGVIDRPEIRQILDIWESSGAPILLTGSAGTGKTGIALRLAQLLENEGTPVLYILATNLPVNQEPATAIQSRLALNLTFGEAFAKLSKERTCSLIIDQLDSVSETELCKNLVSLLKAISGFPNTKILAVSRAIELDYDSDIASLNFQTLESENLTSEQAIAYLSTLGLHQPSEIIIDLAGNLLNLSLIAEILGDNNIIAHDIENQIDLWQRYYEIIHKREGDKTAAFALELAYETAKKGELTFSAPIPFSGLWRKLISCGILVEASGKRLAFRHEQIQAFLCAYFLLPQRPTVAQLEIEFDVNISNNIIAWLHRLYHAECPDEESDFVDDILAAKSWLPFFTRTVILDNLKSQQNPSLNIAKALTEHLSERSYSRYFFDGLENPAWINPLYKAGYFYTPPNPIEVEPGSYKLPPWLAGEYLARFAKDYDDIVVDLVQSIQTENWHVQEILIGALVKISSDKAAALVGYIDPWLRGRFSDMLPPKISELSTCLLESGCSEAALQLLNSVVTPVLPLDTRRANRYRSELQFRSEHFWVNEYYGKQLPKLLEFAPVGVVTVFAQQLQTAIELIKQAKGDQAELYVGQYWRRDIPNRYADRGDADVLDILIDGLRDGLVQVCQHFPEDGGTFLTAYLKSEHLIFQRLALYTLRLSGQKIPELIEQVFLQRGYLKNVGCTTEYQGLLRGQFTTASEETRSQVISWILEGPSDLESRAKNRARWENREVNDKDRREVCDYWVLYHLEIVREHLTGKALERLNDLVARLGKPDIEERPQSAVTSWVGKPSPVPAEQMTEMSFDELKQLFMTYVPGDMDQDSRERLAEALQWIARDDPVKYGDFAYDLIDPGIRYVYAYHYLLGTHEGLKNNNGQLTEAVISLCEYIVSQKDDPFIESPGHYEPGLVSSQLETARLLEEALRSRNSDLSRDLLDRIRSVLVALSNHSDPGNEDDNSNFDPYTHSLNCIRGVTMHGIMHYALYIHRHQEKDENTQPQKRELEETIQAVLEEKLDKNKDPSTAVHSVFGAFFPQLHYLAPHWAEQHLDEIFPVSKNQFDFWKAAWDAYLFVSNVYRNVFILLIPQYRRALQLLGHVQEEEKQLGGSPNKKLAQHIMSSYLAELTDFDHQNQILDLFFANAPDPVRANGIFWLTKVLEEQKPTIDSDLWKKLWVLWQKRIQSVEGVDPSQNNQEISVYMRWLNNVPVGLEILYPILRQTVKYLYNGFDARQLTAYAATFCEKLPFEAVTLLRETIYSAKEPWWTPEEKDEEMILRSAIVCGIPLAKQIATEVINYRGEHGDFRWKNLIE